MRTRWLLVMIAGASTLPLPAQATGGDWRLFDFTVGAAGASRIAIAITYPRLQSSGDPVVVGQGWGLTWTSTVRAVNFAGEPELVFDIHAAGVHERTTVQRLPVDGSRPLYSWTSVYGELEPGSRFPYLLFIAGGSFIGEPSFDVSWIGDVTLQERQGSGSHVITFDDVPNREAVIAGVGGAGVLEHSARVEEGVVGAMIDDCEFCTGSWTSPDGRSKSWTAARAGLVSYHDPANLPPSFAGPAGGWEWAYQGVTSSQTLFAVDSGMPILAAYAPVGDAWGLFA